MHFRVMGTVSRSSVSTSTLPLYFGSNRSQIEFTSGASWVLTISPVIPLCQGTVKSRFGSAVGWRRNGIRLCLTFGSFA